MRLKLLFFFCLFTAIAAAQYFTGPFQDFSIAQVERGSVAFSDVDGDGDSDLMITGRNNTGDRISKLYTSDGAGNYTELPNAPFEGVKRSSIAFSDVDGDGDSDVLITGLNASENPISKLYTNDGMGSYSEVEGTPFEGVYESSVAFSDVDGDGDNDVLITGLNSQDDGVTQLYLNDGSGSYSEAPDSQFEDVYFSSVAFSDVDGDGDSDVLITGKATSGLRISKLYTNDGSGSYSEVDDTPFPGIDNGSIAFSDVDGDGDNDVLIAGQVLGQVTFDEIAILYTNDGSGSYTEVPNVPFEGVIRSSVAFADVDGDGDSDVLITGRYATFVVAGSAKLYLNDGSGIYSEEIGTPFPTVYDSSMAFSDIDGDGDSDVLITGSNPSGYSRFYRNDGSGSYSEIITSMFTGVWSSSMAFSDVDGDGDSDVLITGGTRSEQYVAKLYLNDGLGVFTEMPDTPFAAVSFGSMAFSDVDGDGDSDVLITGTGIPYASIAKLYINDGSGSYSEVPDTPFEGVTDSFVAFSDVDGDGDEDVLITGWSFLSGRISKLYTNDGSGSFSEVEDTPFENVNYGSSAFSDVDGDGDNDLLITGYGNLEFFAKLYTNDGSGSFSEVINSPFEGVYRSSVAFSDVDGDGDSDVLISGFSSQSLRNSKLYRNDGTGAFSEVTDTPFEGSYSGTVSFSDIDADGDSDVLITGEDSESERIAKLYTNNGAGVYSEVMDSSLDGVWISSAAFTDVDGDGAGDLLITGQSNENEPTSKLYLNNGLISLTDHTTNPINFDFTVYPNPTASSRLNLSFNSKEANEVSLTIYSIQGVMIKQKMEFTTIGEQTISLNIESLTQGNYLIELDKGTSKGVAKFVVE